MHPETVADHGEVLHVFDLPQIFSKPSAQVLLETLDFFTLELPSWSPPGADGKEAVHSLSPLESTRADCCVPGPPRRKRRISPSGAAGYLTAIIASNLGWIQSDELKERIWDQASLRLSERCGRTAMHSISRSFCVPTATHRIDIAIHEPTLTADNLGFKTWASSYLLARRLHLLDLPLSRESHTYDILELGSGTGLVGIAAAAVLGAAVCLTDLPDIEPNLAHNVRLNQAVIDKGNGCASTAVLDWADPAAFQVPGPPSNHVRPIRGLGRTCGNESQPRFRIVMAADCLYSPEHPRLLVQAIDRWLTECPDARVVVELPLREGYTPEIRDFRSRMGANGLSILEEGEEVGHDDWVVDESGRLRDVLCWWAVWGRRH